MCAVRVINYNLSARRVNLTCNSTTFVVNSIIEFEIAIERKKKLFSFKLVYQSTIITILNNNNIYS